MQSNVHKFCEGRNVRLGRLDIIDLALEAVPCGC